MTIIEWLEAAAGPDRELDVEIGLLIDWKHPSMGGSLRWLHSISGTAWCVEMAENPQNILRELPRYTGSIDAAVTLLRDGWLKTESIPGEPNGALATAGEWAWAETLPLAICIAALTARSAS